ncbi:MBL fold metallo-hydrolase [Pollutibacter soli]|uniref:MBL fold metallo-hydrolase n=1 Tax=Pollutibacter soli TaxID=3034157 RepID=UPI003013B738
MKNIHSILIIFIVFIFSITTSAMAQLPAADIIKTNKSDIIIQPVFHGSIVIRLGDKTVYVDPYHGGKAYKDQALPDFVLITDIHGDHMDTGTLHALDLSKAKLIVPQAVADKLPPALKAKSTVLPNGQKWNDALITVTALPMYNIPDDSTSRHTKGRGNGYVISYGGKNIYISGDTEDIPEMRALKNIDVAFVCMNQPYTMTIEQAANAVLEFRPKMVYPYHYRGAQGFSDTEAFKKLVNEGNKGIDVRLRNWYVE